MEKVKQYLATEFPSILVILIGMRCKPLVDIYKHTTSRIQIQILLAAEKHNPEKDAGWGLFSYTRV